MIAYAIGVHHEPAQFARMLRAIHSPENVYLVHVNAYSDPAPFAAIAEEYDNVELVESMPYVWGGPSSLGIFHHLTRCALVHDFSHLVNLSGQDFPLVTQDDMRLESGMTYMHTAPIGECWNEQRWRVDHYWRDCYGTLEDMGPREWPFEFEPMGGTPWFCLSRQMCEFFIEHEDGEVARFYANTFAPDEGYWQTMACMSGLPVTDDDMRYVIWDGGAHPLELTSADVPAMLASGARFARKFAPDSDALLILEGRLCRAR